MRERTSAPRRQRRNANHSAGNERWLILYDLRHCLVNDDCEQVERGVYWLTRSLWARVWYDSSRPARQSINMQWRRWRAWAKRRGFVVGHQEAGYPLRESGLAVSIDAIDSTLRLVLGRSQNFVQSSTYGESC